MNATFEQVFNQARQLPLNEQLNLAMALIEQTRQLLPISVQATDATPDRAALLKEVRGSMRGQLSSSDDFLREKHAELERELEREARWQQERKAA